MPAGSRWVTNAILVPSGDHAGHDAPNTPGSLVSCVRPEPSGLAVKICDEFPAYWANTILPLPPGGVAPAGWEATPTSAVDATRSAVTISTTRHRFIRNPPDGPQLPDSGTASIFRRAHPSLKWHRWGVS